MKKDDKNLEGMLIYCYAMRSSTSSEVGTVKCLCWDDSDCLNSVARLLFFAVFDGAELQIARYGGFVVKDKLCYVKAICKLRASGTGVCSNRHLKKRGSPFVIVM